MRKEIENCPAKYPDFKLTDKLILHKSQIWLPQGLPIILTLLTEYHSTPTGGPTGIAKTLARLSENFYWSSMRVDVTQFVTTCIDCQHTKYETKRIVGLLCPLLVPHRPWENLSLDFITSLPPYHGHTVILVVVDRFSKGIHLGMLTPSHTAHTVACLFIEIVAKLHGIPRSLVSDCDPLFVSNFWQELFRLSGTKLQMSSAYHPQSDGQTEVLNRVIEQYLRAFVHRRPGTWGKLLSWIEWSHNTSWNVGTSTTPYEIMFGRKPCTIPDYITDISDIAVFETMLTDREDTFKYIRKKLLKAQGLMKHHADTRRRDVEYQVGDWVMLKLRPHRQTSIREPQEHTDKLVMRFYGPFSITERIGQVAYRLQLLAGACIHPVFQCSLLKPFKGTPPSDTTGQLPEKFFGTQPIIALLAILEHKQILNDPPR